MVFGGKCWAGPHERHQYGTRKALFGRARLPEEAVLSFGIARLIKARRWAQAISRLLILNMIGSPVLK